MYEGELLLGGLGWQKDRGPYIASRFCCYSGLHLFPFVSLILLMWIPFTLLHPRLCSVLFVIFFAAFLHKCTEHTAQSGIKAVMFKWNRITYSKGNQNSTQKNSIKNHSRDFSVLTQLRSESLWNTNISAIYLKGQQSWRHENLMGGGQEFQILGATMEKALLDCSLF